MPSLGPRLEELPQAGVVGFARRGHLECDRLVEELLRARRARRRRVLVDEDVPRRRRAVLPRALEVVFLLLRFLLRGAQPRQRVARGIADQDRKSTLLNSSHQIISYAVF